MAETRAPLGADPRLLKVLGHPLRWEVFSRLGERPWSATQLEPVLQEPWKRIREQIRILVKAGLAEPVGKVSGPKGGRLTLYRAVRFYFTADAWAALPEQIRDTGSFTFIELLSKDALAALESGAMESRDDRALLRHPLWTDDQGAKELEEIMVRAHREVEAVERRSLKRRSEAGGLPVHMVTALLSFPASESGGRSCPS